jgi:hypothetical protein
MGLLDMSLTKGGVNNRNIHGETSVHTLCTIRTKEVVGKSLSHYH